MTEIIQVFYNIDFRWILSLDFDEVFLRYLIESSLANNSVAREKCDMKT